MQKYDQVFLILSGNRICQGQNDSCGKHWAVFQNLSMDFTWFHCTNLSDG